MEKILLEICCGSADDCVEAARGGADRVELNSALFLGGLTPTAGTLRAARNACDISIMAMIRPRAGGFCYTAREFETMEYDARELLELGADGIVFGCLTPEGKVDIERNARLVKIAHDMGKQAVFHRAIDVVPNWRAALDALIAMGADRVLTSGQMPSAPLGLDVIAEMVEYAAGRIEILPGAGINLNNIRSVIKSTGCNQAHMSAKARHTDSSCNGNTAIHFGGALYPPEDAFDIVDSARVSALKERI
jgi:copper homeostasis protein